MRDVGCLGGDCREFLRTLGEGRVALVVVAGSTRTSTIPGLSIAGPSPQATLWTPTLDVEYLVAGRPLSLDVIPVSPQGLPTPAVITRAIVEELAVSLLVVDAGVVYEPRIPHVRLPSRTPGGRIDVERALPEGVAERLFSESRMLGRMLARGFDVVIVGETIPGGTTVAAALLEALCCRGLGRVSSSSASNPHELRSRVVERALSRLRVERGLDVFDVVECVGDPVHVSIAGLAAGIIDAGAWAGLGGGTQMAAVLALMSRIESGALERTVVLTTPWIISDPSSDIEGLVRDAGGGVPIVYPKLSFSSMASPGLRAYEKGYVKEGVAAGASMVLGLARGLGVGALLELIESEYVRVAAGGG
ncbi:MAG: TIGR00303 family protein [Hyperthermus sp.]|nr:MAG: TIGR00303 family protein [Hyperthermus sp.]